MNADWRVELAAAREPASPAQQVWDPRWCARYQRLVEGGKTPNQAVPIADRLTKRQHGSRPEPHQGAHT